MRRILLIDDEPKVLLGLRRMLHSQESVWEMAFAHSSSEAQELWAQQAYDVIVLDVNMPGKDGLELLADIKADSRTRDTEVVVLTGSRDELLKRRALDLGAADLLSKPVPKEDLLARLRSVLRIKTGREELRARNEDLARQLLQAQRMELVAVLASSAAHGLNNLLTLILGYADFAVRDLSEDLAIQQYLKQIMGAGRRAVDIVQQIRALSKPSNGQRELCRLGALAGECLELLRPSIPREIEIEWQSPQIRDWIEADTTQVYQMLMNLCINAAQAMADGGLLSVSLAEAPVDVDSGPPGSEMHPGQYLRLEVSDTGEGMDDDTLARIFEPLYTTKGSLGGTGLGLCIVQRIVKSHSGGITVESYPGKGTTFSVYLPNADRTEVPR